MKENELSLAQCHNKLHYGAERTSVLLFENALRVLCNVFHRVVSICPFPTSDLFHLRAMCSLQFVELQQTAKHILVLSLSISQTSLLFSPLQ